MGYWSVVFSIHITEFHTLVKADRDILCITFCVRLAHLYFLAHNDNIQKFEHTTVCLVGFKLYDIPFVCELHMSSI